jgi:hypothetical protein
MQSARNARGMTLLGFVIVLIIAGFFAFIIMKLFPPYAEHHAVGQAMLELADEPGVAQKSPADIRKMLDAKLYINYVTLKPEAVKIDRTGQGYTLTVKYESRGNMVGNLDYVVNFDKTVVLGPGLR